MERPLNLSDLRESLDLLTILLADYVVEEICASSNNLYATTIYPNLNPRLQNQCQTIDDLYELDINPLIAVCRSVKSNSSDLKLIDSKSIFYGYISLVQQIRNQVSHASSNTTLSFLTQVNWISSLYLLISEFPKTVQKRDSYQKLHSFLEERINILFGEDEPKKEEKKSEIQSIQVEEDIDDVKMTPDQKIELLSNLQQEIWSSHPGDRLTACILTRQTINELKKLIEGNEKLVLDLEGLKTLIGSKSFSKISVDQHKYLKDINDVIN